jgi:hypothetical protein
MAESYRIYMDNSGNADLATTNLPERRHGSVTAVMVSDGCEFRANPDIYS